MIEFAGSQGNGPFTIALLVMLLLAFFEIASTLIGNTLSGLLDTLLPNIDIDADIESNGWFNQSLSWLGFGSVPFLILLIIFLTCFGLVGLLVQYTAQSLFGSTLPAVLAILPALLITLPFVRTGSRTIAAILPQEESSAVSISSFAGRHAIIIQGTAEKSLAAEAKVHDEHGAPHYILVIPDDDKVTFPRGTKVVLVEHIKGKRYKAVLFDHEPL